MIATNQFTIHRNYNFNNFKYLLMREKKSFKLHMCARNAGIINNKYNVCRLSVRALCIFA